jgi:hypothetical protein
MSLLDSLFGGVRVFVSGVELVTRKSLDFVGGLTVVDNPTTGRTEVSLATVVPQTLADAATTNFDVAAGANALWTIGGDRTLAFLNVQDGQSGFISVQQDGTGTRLLAGVSVNGTTFIYCPGGSLPVLATAANARDLLSWFFDGTVLFLQLVGVAYDDTHGS